MRVYLDHNASTPVDPRVLDLFVEVEREHGANPGSLHASGRRARAVVENARAEIAHCFGLEPDNVLFTSGGTEANNIAIAGHGDPALPVLLSRIEHLSGPEQLRPLYPLVGDESLSQSRGDYLTHGGPGER